MRLLHTILLFFLLLSPLPAQEEHYAYHDRNTGRTESFLAETPNGSPAIIARISLITPKFILEFAPVEHFTFFTGIRIWPTFWERNEADQIEFQPVPSLNTRIILEPRYFYTQAHRKKTGRRTDYHSGWYIGLPFTLDIPELNFTMGTVMGFQCTFGRRWYWNAGAGPGVSYELNRFQMSLSGNLGFGVILN